jgi:hypothetical protein
MRALASEAAGTVAAETVLIGARLVMPPHSSSNNAIAIAIKTTRMAASYALKVFFSHKEAQKPKMCRT